jgi:flagellar export protein FliJ
MKQFVWRLQKVLDVKVKEEQLRRTELFRLTERLAAKRGELLMHQRILREAMTGIHSERPTERVSTQALFLKHATANDERIRRLSNEVNVLEQEHRQKTNEVLAVRRFTEGLEKLRQEAKERFLRDQERLEQKTLDEMTTISFARNDNRRSQSPMRYGSDGPAGLHEERNP